MERITKDNAGFFTQQLFLIGTRDEDGTPHFAPFSWISFTWGPPSCLVFSMNGRTRVKQTARNIDRTGLLSATVVTPDLLPFVEQHNRATQNADDHTAREAIPGRVLDVPLLKDAVWSFECEVIQTVPVGDCPTYFAAYRHVNVREDIQELDFCDLRVINPVVYTDHHYFTVGAHLGQIGDFS